MIFTQEFKNVPKAVNIFLAALTALALGEVVKLATDDVAPSRQSFRVALTCPPNAKITSRMEWQPADHTNAIVDFKCGTGSPTAIHLLGNQAVLTQGERVFDVNVRAAVDKTESDPLDPAYYPVQAEVNPESRDLVVQGASGLPLVTPEG